MWGLSMAAVVLTAYLAGIKHSYDWDHLAAIGRDALLLPPGPFAGRVASLAAISDFERTADVKLGAGILNADPDIASEVVVVSALLINAIICYIRIIHVDVKAVLCTAR